WIKTHIAEHGGDPGKVFIGGHSAGAYLTLMLGLDERYLARHGLKLADIAGLVPVAGQTLTHYTVRVERGLPKETIIADEAAPLHHARKDAPPILILYAEKDMPMRAQENELLAAALRAAGHTGISIRMMKGTNHGSVGHNLAKAGDYGRELVLTFIRHLSPNSP
ncbi:MAG TPA: prolyl oligopeptidase family serine peptidase, partial [Prosthecobacter sp.]|nr:prolyl oligopeptidase family serine peptidase [Prosthecobacter sp.]